MHLEYATAYINRTIFQYLVVVAISYHGAIASTGNCDNYKCDYRMWKCDVFTNWWLYDIYMVCM